MSYDTILDDYPEIHRRCVLLGQHVQSFPSVEDEPVHAERDRLTELVAQLWEDMRQRVIPASEERAVPADVVSKRDIDDDHEEETRGYEVTIRGERVSWERKETRMNKAAVTRLEEATR